MLTRDDLFILGLEGHVDGDLYSNCNINKMNSSSVGVGVGGDGDGDGGGGVPWVLNKVTKVGLLLLYSIILLVKARLSPF